MFHVKRRSERAPTPGRRPRSCSTAANMEQDRRQRRRGHAAQPARSAERRGARGSEPLDHLVRQAGDRSEEHTSELQSLMRISYAVFCLKKKKKITHCKYEHVTHKKDKKVDIMKATTK